MKIAHTISKLGELANPFAEVFTEVFTEELLHCRVLYETPTISCAWIGTRLKHLTALPNFPSVFSTTQ